MDFFSFSLLLLTLLAFSAVLSSILSACMEYLYRKNAHILSYPSLRRKYEHRRSYLLAPSLFICYIGISMGAASPLLLLLHGVFLTFMLFITFTDFEQYVIFDKVLLPLLLLALLFTPFLQASLSNRLLAAFAGGLLMFLLAVFTRGGIGGGDIKLIFALGFWLGTELLFSVLILGFITSGIAAILLLLTKKKNRNDAFAYGPYFALTALLLFLH
jgi:leader peptidase (prepilin peptidase) / N-methyltransferase